VSVIEALNFPKANLRLSKKGDQVFVWCILRKKDLVCTPEEWVRQHVVHFLIHQKAVPEGLIASEYSLEYNGRKKRADVVVFGRDRRPILIVECKATHIPITEETLQQIAQYNFDLNVDLLFLTNGLQHVFCEIDRKKGTLNYLEDLPVLFE